MPVASIYIQEKSPDKNGWCKIILSFSYKGKRLFTSTGEKTPPDFF